MPNNIKNISLHIVNDRLVVGGVATIIRMIRSDSLARGATCTLWVDEIGGRLEKETRRVACGLIGWRKLITLLLAFFPIKLIFSILHDKRQHRYPVLHLNTPYLSTAIATLTAAFWTRTPLIYTVHANKSHISSFYWALEKFIYFRADRVVLELSASLSDYSDMNARKISFIPFGVRSANTVKKWKARSSGPFIFVAVNRMDRNRMVDVFIKAFAAQMAGTGSVLHLIGEGADKKELIALAERLGCGERVKFFPAVDEVDIQNVLVNCDCFLTLTAHGEVGMAGKLAAGVGIPCLAYEFDHKVPTDYSAVSTEQLSVKMAAISCGNQSDLQAHAKRTTAALYSSSEDMVEAYMETYSVVSKRQM